MSQDIVADALNMIMNAQRAGKKSVVLIRYSTLLFKIFDLMKDDELIDYKIDKKNKNAEVSLLKINKCKAIKPRFNVKSDEIEKYIRRFLPARGVGVVVVSTSKGLMRHDNAIKENLGGSLIAYYF